MITIETIINSRVHKEQGFNKLFNYEKKLEIMNMLVLPIAEQFLKENDCLREFIDNYNSYNKIKAKNLDEILFKYKKSSIYNIISGGFSWIETPQGSIYWSKKSRNYYIFLSNFLHKDVNLI